MEAFSEIYSSSFRKLISIYGNPQHSSILVEKLLENKELDWNDYNFKCIGSDIQIPPKKDKRMIGKNPGEGIMRANWLEKYCQLLPSVMIFLLDWSENASKNTNMINTAESSISKLKKLTELETKNICFIPCSPEGVGQYIKRFDKNIQEMSKNCYGNLIKRQKKRIQKANDIITNIEFNVRVHLKMAVFYEFASKSEKAKAAYDTAYSYIVQNIFPYYAGQLANQGKLKNANYIIGNYETIEHLEELRFLSDFIKIRLMFIYSKLDEISSIYQQFMKHFSTFKNRIDYFDSRCQFEEYKWKSRLFYYVSIILMQAYQRNPRTVLNDNLNLLNTIYGFCESNLKRRELFLKHCYASVKDMDKVNLVAETLYIGFYKYRYLNSSPLDFIKYNDPQGISDILRHRLFKERNVDILGININMLIQALEIAKKQSRFLYMLKYSLAQHHFLKDQVDQFNTMFRELVNEIESSSWNDLLITILRNNEQFLLLHKDYLNLIENCIKLILYDDYVEDRVKVLNNALQTTKSQFNLSFPVKSSRLFKVLIYFEPHQVEYLDYFDIAIRIKIPNYLMFMVSTIELKFNEPLYNKVLNVNDFDFENGILSVRVKIHANHMVNGNQLYVEDVYFTSAMKKGRVDQMITFSLNKQLLLENYRNIVFLQSPNDIDIMLNSRQPGYVNEMVDIVATIRKKNEKAIVRNAMLSLYIGDKNSFYDITNSKQMLQNIGITFYYYDEYMTLQEYNGNLQNTAIEFDQVNQKTHHFAIKCTSEMQKSIQFKIKYEVHGEKGREGIIPKETIAILESNTVSPLQSSTFWRINLELKHVIEDKLYKSFLVPLNNTALQQIQFSPLYGDLIIKQMNLDLKNGEYYKVLKEPLFDKEIALPKQNRYSTNLVIKTEREGDDLKLGYLEIYLIRSEDINSNKGPIKAQISLESITIKQKPFSVDVSVPSSCVIGEYIEYKVTLYNHTLNMHRFDLSIEENDSFFISGFCKQNLDILPKSSRELKWIALAIKTGKCRMPNCVIKCTSYEGQIVYSEAKLISVFPYSIPNI